ncbi:hypothetical protein CYMTET_32607 [Cymbomonas tetramitiformis]|uniref:Uncharacterized protein n=1 Tax=Cymbomonas tetramitiformis TaxID=36881 RepID=A0AAE0FEQ6_9CHLO|nr:hypothetical protein CYMTET_32607 [Cymbomonas tetramitiformis]
MWMYHKSDQDSSSTLYFMDARNGDLGGSFSSSIIGDLWISIWVDGLMLHLPVWDHLPVDSWGHVHLVASRAFSDDINLFSRAADGGDSSGHLKARLAEVYVWGRQLDETEIAIIAKGFAGYPSKCCGLLALYRLEEGQGSFASDLLGIQDRAYLAGEPAWVLDRAAYSGYRAPSLVPTCLKSLYPSPLPL